MFSFLGRRPGVHQSETDDGLEKALTFCALTVDHRMGENMPVVGKRQRPHAKHTLKDGRLIPGDCLSIWGVWDGARFGSSSNGLLTHPEAETESGIDLVGLIDSPSLC